LFVGLGAIVGFAGGLFAIGGALVAIPLLTAAFGFSQHDSQGTAMVMALASASVTLVIYARKKLLRVRDDLIMAACSTALGLVSSQTVRYINDRTLQRGFGAFLIVLAVFVWFGHLGEGDRSAPLPAPAQGGSPAGRRGSAAPHVYGSVGGIGGRGSAPHPVDGLLGPVRLVAY